MRRCQPAIKRLYIHQDQIGRPPPGSCVRASVASRVNPLSIAKRRCASAEVSWLRAVHVTARGNLEGVEALHGQFASAQFIEGEIVLLIELLALLEAFIGPVLTSRLVGEIWPQSKSAL